MFKVIEAENEFGSYTVVGAPYFSNTQWRKLLSPFIKQWAGKPCKVYPEPIKTSMFQISLDRGGNKVSFISSFPLEGVEFHVSIIMDVDGNLISVEVAEPQDKQISCPLPYAREAFIQDEEYFVEGEEEIYETPNLVRPGWLSVSYVDDTFEEIEAVREDGRQFRFNVRH